MTDMKFDTLLLSFTNSELKKIISDYNDKCIKEDRKDEKMKGYSGLDKDGLVEFIESYLSDEEKTSYIKELAPNLAKKLISDAVDLLLGDHNREKISEISKISDGIGYELLIKGFSWDVTTIVELMEEEVELDCSCRIGKNDGFCFHQMAGILMMYNSNEITIDIIPLNINKKWLEPYMDKLSLISGTMKPKDEADILFTDEYQILITGNLITTKWEGEYSGCKTVDVSKEGTSVDSWVTKKVVDKILKPIKVKAKTGNPRLMKIDKYGILSKIFADQKLIDKMIKKIREVDDSVTENERDLWEYLRSDLIVDNNPDYEEIKKVLPPTEKPKKSSKKKTTTSKKKTKKSSRKKKTS